MIFARGDASSFACSFPRPPPPKLHYDTDGKKHSRDSRAPVLGLPIFQIPDNGDGRRLLRRLKYAFLHDRPFILAHPSLQINQSGVITWASIHHKTFPVGGSSHHGWPGAGYFLRCNKELSIILVYQRHVIVHDSMLIVWQGRDRFDVKEIYACSSTCGNKLCVFVDGHVWKIVNYGIECRVYVLIDGWKRRNK